MMKDKTSRWRERKTRKVKDRVRYLRKKAARTTLSEAEEQELVHLTSSDGDADDVPRDPVEGGDADDVPRDPVEGGDGDAVPRDAVVADNVARDDGDGFIYL